MFQPNVALSLHNLLEALQTQAPVKLWRQVGPAFFPIEKAHVQGMVREDGSGHNWIVYYWNVAGQSDKQFIDLSRCPPVLFQDGRAQRFQ